MGGPHPICREREMSSARMSVAICGVGRMGSFHAANLRRHPDVAALRVFDADQERAAATAGELDALAAGSLDEALDGVNAAVIATPSAIHAAIIDRCLEAGIPAFTEKPLALDLAETSRVVKRIADAR